MYLSGRTAVQFQSPARTLPVAHAASQARRALSAPRYIYFAFPSCRAPRVAFPVCVRADIPPSLLSAPIAKLAQRASTLFVPQQTLVARQDDLEDNLARWKPITEYNYRSADCY